MPGRGPHRETPKSQGGQPRHTEAAPGHHGAGPRALDKLKDVLQHCPAGPREVPGDDIKSGASSHQTGPTPSSEPFPRRWVPPPPDPGLATSRHQRPAQSRHMTERAASTSLVPPARALCPLPLPRPPPGHRTGRPSPDPHVQKTPRTNRARKAGVRGALTPARQPPAPTPRHHCLARPRPA